MQGILSETERDTSMVHGSFPKNTLHNKPRCVCSSTEFQRQKEKMAKLGGEINL